MGFGRSQGHSDKTGCYGPWLESRTRCLVGLQWSLAGLKRHSDKTGCNCPLPGVKVKDTLSSWAARVLTNVYRVLTNVYRHSGQAGCNGPWLESWSRPGGPKRSLADVKVTLAAPRPLSCQCIRGQGSSSLHHITKAWAARKEVQTFSHSPPFPGTLIRHPSSKPASP